MKILIIEDDVVIRNELKILLENSGYEAFIIADLKKIKRGDSIWHILKGIKLMMIFQIYY